MELIGIGWRVVAGLAALGMAVSLSAAKPEGAGEPGGLPDEPEPDAAQAAPLASTNGFLYANRDIGGVQNVVAAFAVAADGSLTPVPGSPFPTGGAALGSAYIAADRATLAGRFLFVSNSASASVSGFTIDPLTGVLTTVPGSPFPLGIPVGDGIALEGTADGRTLYVAAGTTILVFAIQPNGSLTAQPGFTRVEPAADFIQAALSPDGRFLALSTGSGPYVFMLERAVDASLSPVAGSPFTSFTSGALAFNAAGDTLYESGFNALAAMSVSPSGSLSHLAGSPTFTGAGTYATTTPRVPGGAVYAIDFFSGQLQGYRPQPDGSLVPLPGSPYVTALAYTNALETDASGRLLFVNSSNGSLGVFQVAADGTITAAPGSPVAHGVLETWSLAAYPRRPLGAGADVGVELLDVPDPVAAGRLLAYSLRVTNHGPMDAVGVVVDLILPAQARYRTLRDPSGWTCQAPYPGAPGGTIRCRTDVSMLPGSITIGVTVTAPPTCSHNQTLVAGAIATSGSTDPDVTNNLASATTVVQGAPCFF